VVLNIGLIIMDILWCLTMRSVWANKPLKNEAAWKAFDNIRSFTLFLSSVNIVLKAVAVVFLVFLKSKKI